MWYNIVWFCFYDIFSIIISKEGGLEWEIVR